MRKLKIFNKEVIPVYTTDTGEKVVTGRELHERLGVTERYSKWFDRMRAYGFKEGIDYTPYQMVHPQNKQNITTHLLKFDMAKHIAMIQRTDTGFEIRQKLIDLEKQATPKSISKPRRKPKDLAVRQHLSIAEAMIKVVGVKPEIAYATALSEAEKESGTDLLSYEKLLPAAEHEIGLFNPTQIGEQLGGINARAVNSKLKQIGLQERQGKDWVIAEAGEGYGEMMPYTNNGHSGYRPLWNQFTVDLLRDYFSIGEADV